MHFDNDNSPFQDSIHITDEVRSYVLERKRDFRVSTSCGGAILLPVSVKPAKSTDLKLHVGDYTVYISKYQARYLDTIHKGMIPVFFDSY
jgi:hypothetical protein